MYADRPAETFFLLTGRGHFLFDVSKRKWGRIPAAGPHFFTETGEVDKPPSQLDFSPNWVGLNNFRTNSPI